PKMRPEAFETGVVGVRRACRQQARRAHVPQRGALPDAGGLRVELKSRRRDARCGSRQQEWQRGNPVEAFFQLIRTDTAFARERDLIMRFIEFMPLDADRHWTRELVVPAAEVQRRIEARWKLEPLPHERSETARKFRFADGRGEIGLIASVTQPFCGFCSRIRITADGKLRTCLFSKDDHDLRYMVRNGHTDANIADAIRAVVNDKEEGHRINQSDFVPPSRTMVYIGG
ncbi:MAG: hypothetical protein M1451_06600, partial [Acidobacteria bacterium]|nr:hypothetical protein [Acidobacteriota bacterium]